MEQRDLSFLMEEVWNLERERQKEKEREKEREREE